MEIKQSLYRIIRYVKIHGLWQASCQFSKKFNSLVFPGLNNLYYVQLSELQEGHTFSPDEFDIVCRQNESELLKDEREALIKHLGEKLFKFQMDERFERHASLLWMAKKNDEILGFVWTVVRNTVRPFYWPLMAGDVHLFNIEVFPEYRGQGIAGQLTCHIVGVLKQRGYKRVFAEVLTTNNSSNSYIHKTPFVQYGIGRRFSLGRYQVGLFYRDWERKVQKNQASKD